MRWIQHFLAFCGVDVVIKGYPAVDMAARSDPGGADKMFSCWTDGVNTGRASMLEICSDCNLFAVRELLSLPPFSYREGDVAPP
jgi:hypothetical protein